MKKHRIIKDILLIALALYCCSCNQQTVQLPTIPVEQVTPYFVDAAEVNTIDTSYYQIKNSDGEQIGTLLFSMPYAENVKGYNGTTPLLIALDAEGRIKNVVLLPNKETPRFAERVVNAGLYQSWDGLTVNEALDKNVDAVTGATYTSIGVKNTLAVRLKAYQRQLQKDHNTKPSFWQRLFKF